MRQCFAYPIVLAVALGLAACGPAEKIEPPPVREETTTVAELDPEPKFIGAPSPQWQTAGDAIRDDTLVRDVTFATEDRGAMVEVVVQPTDATVRVQLVNNEGLVLGETSASASQEAHLTGQATGGDRNMVRVFRDTRTSAPTPFTVRIRTIPESP